MKFRVEQYAASCEYVLAGDLDNWICAVLKENAEHRPVASVVGRRGAVGKCDANSVGRAAPRGIVSKLGILFFFYLWENVATNVLFSTVNFVPWSALSHFRISLLEPDTSEARSKYLRPTGASLVQRLTNMASFVRCSMDAPLSPQRSLGGCCIFMRLRWLGRT